MTQVVPSSVAKGWLCAAHWITQNNNYTNDASLLSSHGAIK